jgi:hypothetical protein
VSFYDIHLNFVLATGLCLGGFCILLYGAYKAHNGELFTIGDILHLTKTKNFLEIGRQEHLDEKDKVSLIMSFVPFLGYFIYAKHKDSETMVNATKVNLFVSICICMLFSF